MNGPNSPGRQITLTSVTIKTDHYFFIAMEIVQYAAFEQRCLNTGQHKIYLPNSETTMLLKLDRMLATIDTHPAIFSTLYDEKYFICEI